MAGRWYCKCCQKFIETDSRYHVAGHKKSFCLKYNIPPEHYYKVNWEMVVNDAMFGIPEVNDKPKKTAKSGDLTKWI